MKLILSTLACTLLLISCSVMSKQFREEAVLVPSFIVLVNDIEKYRGQTTIVGGHILKVQSKPTGTVITALQVPLRSGEKPGSRDASEGRVIISTSQFLDPEIYTKNRKITVGGKIIGSSQDEKEAVSFPYLKLEAMELYLWPQYEAPRHHYPYNHPFWYWDDPWYYPYPFFSLRYWHHYHRRYRCH